MRGVSARVCLVVSHPLLGGEGLGIKKIFFLLITNIVVIILEDIHEEVKWEFIKNSWKIKCVTQIFVLILNGKSIRDWNLSECKISTGSSVSMLEVYCPVSSIIHVVWKVVSFFITISYAAYFANGSFYQIQALSWAFWFSSWSWYATDFVEFDGTQQWVILECNDWITTTKKPFLSLTNNNCIGSTNFVTILSLKCES